MMWSVHGGDASSSGGELLQRNTGSTLFFLTPPLIFSPLTSTPKIIISKKVLRGRGGGGRGCKGEGLYNPYCDCHYVHHYGHVNKLNKSPRAWKGLKVYT